MKGDKRMYKIGMTGVLLIALGACYMERPIETRIKENPSTFCNPLNLDYRFMKIDGGNGIREAADPVVTHFKGQYFLFASKSSGYWYSSDFSSWTHVVVPDSVLPVEDYAPAVFEYEGHLYYTASSGGNAMLYRSDNPQAGVWEKVKEIPSYWDPAFYVENDKLYLYYGSSPVNPIYGTVLDLKTLEIIKEPFPCLNSDKEHHGWERSGAYHEEPQRPYIEGAWMTEHNGKYYLQYATPGTQWKTYADGTYVADSPVGPFVYAPNNPVSYKPGGFIGGAGHGCLFQVGPNYWKAATNSISIRHWFERRLSFYPAYFDADGYLYSETAFGDYPMFLPTEETGKNIRPEWMLLSFHKPVTASSVKDDFSVEKLVDEDVRTAWVANSNQEEWVQIDLLNPCKVYAIQVNYDEYGANQKGIVPDVYQSYVLSASKNGKDWYVIADKSRKKTDTPHDYIEFEVPFDTRYIKWENKAYTVSSNVSLREIRVFGKGYGKKPEKVQALHVERDSVDACKCRLIWDPVSNADGYVIRYGISPDKLYNSIQVSNDSARLDFRGLNADQNYYFSIAAYNENGISQYLENLNKH